MTDTKLSDRDDREVELEYKCRKIQQECRKVTEYTLGGVNDTDVVLTVDSVSVGVMSSGGPTFDFENDGLIEYLLNEHGLRVRGFTTDLNGIDPAESSDVEPDDPLTTETADMPLVRRRWLREHLETKLLLVLVDPDLE